MGVFFEEEMKPDSLDELFGKIKLNIDKTQKYTKGNVNNQCVEYGKSVWKNGNSYKGNWKDNKKNGHGMYKWANGDEYRGNWKDNKKNGYGVNKWAVSGNEYRGNWKDNKKNGYGVNKWEDGDEYHGNWSNDVKHGQGVLKQGNKVIKKGKWKKGDFINVILSI